MLKDSIKGKIVFGDKKPENAQADAELRNNAG